MSPVLRPHPPSAPEPDPVSFEAVFRAHYPGLCEFVTGYVRSADIAHELVQDLFLRIWELQGTPNAPPLTKAYLYSAARNRAIKHLRHERVVVRWEERASREAEPSEASAADEVHCLDLADAAARAIASLPERCRMVYTLSRQQHLSYAEIAQILGIAESTVETQMWRALKHLRTRLAPFLLTAASVFFR
jgi:RNA polymerase sigma-19 factor, ECF subfamily